MPTTVVDPVTAYVVNSLLPWLDDQLSPVVGLALRIGSKPKFIRSKGVTKWFRLAAGAPWGPSAGNLASVAEEVVPQRFVTPFTLFENPYVPLTVIGPDTFCTVKRALLFATSSIANFSTSGFFRYLVFVQL